MKKLLLLLATGFVVSSAVAQDNSNVQQFNPAVGALQSKIADIKNHPMIYNPSVVASHRNTDRTTSGTATSGAWFDYFDANFVNPGYILYYFEVFPDSNLLDPANVSATSSGYFFTHGMGMSFDPTDNGYYTPAGVTVAGAPITNADPFNIDSVQLLGRYFKNDASSNNDSLIVDLIVIDNASNDGTYLLHNNPSPVGVYTFVATDDTPRVALANYMPSNFATAQYQNDCWDSITVMNSCPSPVYAKVRLGQKLALADTPTVNGFHTFTFFVKDSLYVPAGKKVMMWVHFKPTTNYALGTTVSAANYMYLFAGDPTGNFPIQSAGSYQTGIMAQNQDAYGYNVFAGHDLPFSPFDFINPASPPAASSPFGFEAPLMFLHLIWPGSCPTTAVNSAVENIASVSAYPNPASDVVTVAFNLTAPAKVSVTLSNMMGQVVATQNVASTNNGKVEFNTVALPAGVYFYTFNANGERTTGRVVVAH